MKKIMNKVNFAIIAMMVSVPAFAAVNESAICGLVKELKGVFQLLRTLAFIGAAFYIAGWAWEFISKPDEKSGPLEKIKAKGQSLLVGFILLFSIGVILSVLVNVSSGGSNILNCVPDAFN